MNMVEVKCKHCKEEFMARLADRKRGWGKFCSKSCKAKHQEKRTGQHKRYLSRCNSLDVSDGNYILGACADFK